MLQQFSTGVLLVFSLFHLLMFLFYPTLKRNVYVGLFAAVIAALVFLNFQHQFAGDLAEHTNIERLFVHGYVQDGQWDGRMPEQPERFNPVVEPGGRTTIRYTYNVGWFEDQYVYEP